MNLPLMFLRYFPATESHLFVVTNSNTYLNCVFGVCGGISLPLQNLVPMISTSIATVLISLPYGSLLNMWIISFLPILRGLYKEVSHFVGNCFKYSVD